MEQLELLHFLIELLNKLHIRYMVVGSYASGAYGEPRLTQDIDIVVDLTVEELCTLLDAIPKEEFYVSEEAARHAIRSGGQFNVIHPESGLKVDFMIARRDAWGQEQLNRRVLLELLENVQAYTARPEDLILSKMLYYQEGGSEKHLRDITGMFKESGDQIDRGYIDKWANELGVADVWQAILNRLKQ